MLTVDVRQNQMVSYFKWPKKHTGKIQSMSKSQRLRILYISCLCNINTIFSEMLSAYSLSHDKVYLIHNCVISVLYFSLTKKGIIPVHPAY